MIRCSIKFFLLILVFSSCIYKAGNRETLMNYLIDNKIKSCIYRKYIDSILISSKISPPDSLKNWIYFPSDAKYFPNDNKLVYFKDSPAEYYLISLDGDLRLNGYHSSDLSADWIYEQSKLPKIELNRIKDRILSSIVIPIKNLEDSTCN